MRLGCSMVFVAYHFSIKMGWKPVVYYYSEGKRHECSLPFYYSLNEARASAEQQREAISKTNEYGLQKEQREG